MTDTWAAKVLEGVPRHNAQDAKSMTGYTSAVWLHEDAVVDAIASMGAGNGLVEEAREVLEGLSGRWPEQYTDEARDTITALLAQNAALRAEHDRAWQEADAWAGKHAWAVRDKEAAEAERDALRAKVARLEGALRHYRETLCEGFCGEDMWADEGHSHPEIQRDCGGCLAASVLLSAALTDGGKDG